MIIKAFIIFWVLFVIMFLTAIAGIVIDNPPSFIFAITKFVFVLR